MLLLKTITLRNFRAVREGTLTPLTDGITGLTGRNGVGKSAFLEGLLWALYGTLPEGSTKSEIRNTLAEPGEECYVQVELLIDGDTITVNRELRGRNAASVLNVYRNGEKVTDTNVGVGERWIEKTTGLSVKAFTTSVLVKQKHLDDLISEGPTDRRKLIEELAGIDRIADALKEARTQANTAKKISDAAVGSEEEVAFAKQEADSAQQQLAELQTQLTTLTEHVEQAQTEHDSATQKTVALRTALQHVEALQQQEATAQNSVDIAQTRLAGAQQTVEALAGSIPNDVNPEEQLAQALTEEQNTKEQLQKTLTLIEQVSVNGQSLRAEIDSLQGRKNENTARITNALNRINEAQTVLPVDENLIEETTRQLDAARATISESKALAHAAQQRIQAATASISVVENQQQSTCPTCQTVLESSDIILESLRKTLDDDTNTVRELTETMNTATRDAEQAATQLKKLNTQQEQWKTAQNALTTTQQEHDTLTTEQENLTALEEKATSAREKALTQWNELKPQRETLEAAHSEAQQNVMVWRNAVAKVEELTRARTAVTEAQQHLRTAQENLATATEQHNAAKETSPTREELQHAAEEEAVAGGNLKATQARYYEAKENVARAEQRHANAQRDYERETAALQRKENLLNDVTTKTATVATLDEFRKAQVARIAPELSEATSTLINLMTDGFYTEVTLDENFTPTLTRHDGEQRPVSWLSGGEKSALALALRIAISDLTTGGGGLLMLDEVLTAQDAARREALVNTLRSLTGRQIIMINHTQGANDIVDKSVILSRGEDGGTIIEENEQGLAAV